MNQKGIAPLAIVAIIVVAAVVVGVGVFVATRGEGVPGEGEGEGEGEGIAGASSLDYKCDLTSPTGTLTYRFRARNIGTANMDIRVDMADIVYILSGSQREGWVYVAGQWMSFSDMGYNFDEQWNTQYGTFTGLKESLIAAGWTGGEWSGTWGGMTVRIYDIDVNPSLPDSLFRPD